LAHNGPALVDTILVVDDEPVVLDVLSDVLAREGFTVTLAPRASAALEELAARSFDLVLSDIRMPGMDGFALAEAVREEARFANLPIIALSSYSSPESIERGREAGFHDYVAKFDRQSLVAALKEQTAVDIIQAA